MNICYRFVFLYLQALLILKTRSTYIPDDDANAEISKAFETYGHKLHRYAVHSWNIESDAAWDLVYKCLYRATEKKDAYTFESEEKYAGFLFRIFVNELKNSLRGPKAVPVVSLQEMEERVPLPEAPFPDHNPQLQILNEELEKLESWERILLLSRSQGVDYNTISSYTGKPAFQLKVYYARLKKRLEKKLNKKLKQQQNDGK